MWILILIGGGISVLILGPFEISGFGELDALISAGIKAIVAIMLVILWIYLLSKIKNWIFKKELNP